MYGMTRASVTLVAAATAGLLVWLATQIGELGLERIQAGSHQVQEGVAAAEPERRPIELGVADESRMLVAATAFEANAEDGRVGSPGQTLQPAKARQGHPRVTVLGTREGVPGRQAVVDHPFVIGRPDGLDERPVAR